MWDWGNPPIPVRRIEVPNVKFMRGQPTNCYIVGKDEVVLVDPGSDLGVDLIPSKLEAFGSPKVKAIFLTHAHPDHAIAAPELRKTLNAPLMLHPDNCPNFRDHISWEDIDIQTDPTEPLVVDGLVLDLIPTAGHAPGHLALFEPESRVFIAGDLVSGNGTIGVTPPNGSMKVYLASLRRAAALRPSVLLPGHGPVLEDPQATFNMYFERRAQREREIVELLTDGTKTIDDILPVLYPDMIEEFRRSAFGTIHAHLEKLEQDGRVRVEGDDPKCGEWSLV